MMSGKPKEKTPYDHLQAALIAVSPSWSAAAIQSLWTVPGLRASRQNTAPGKPDIYFCFFSVTY